MTWGTLALSIFDKYLDKTPDYDQRQRKKYHALKRKYLKEKKSSNRDDNLVVLYRNELRLFIEASLGKISE